MVVSGAQLVKYSHFEALWCFSSTLRLFLSAFYFSSANFALWMQPAEFLGVNKLDPCQDDVGVVKAGVDEEKLVTWSQVALADEELIAFSTLDRFTKCKVWADVEEHECVPSGKSRHCSEPGAVATSSSACVASVVVLVLLLLDLVTLERASRLSWNNNKKRSHVYSFINPEQLKQATPTNKKNEWIAKVISLFQQWRCHNAASRSCEPFDSDCQHQDKQWRILYTPKSLRNVSSRMGAKTISNTILWWHRTC